MDHLFSEDLSSSVDGEAPRYDPQPRGLMRSSPAVHHHDPLTREAIPNGRTEAPLNRPISMEPVSDRSANLRVPVDTRSVIRFLTGDQEEMIGEYKDQPFIQGLIHNIWRQINAFGWGWNDIRYKWDNQGGWVDVLPYLRWYCSEPFDLSVFDQTLSQPQMYGLLDMINESIESVSYGEVNDDRLIEKWPEALPKRDDVKVLWRKLRESWGLVSPYKKHNTMPIPLVSNSNYTWDSRRAALESYRRRVNYGAALLPPSVNLREPWKLSTFGHMDTTLTPVGTPTLRSRATEKVTFKFMPETFSSTKQRLQYLTDCLFDVEGLPATHCRMSSCNLEQLLEDTSATTGSIEPQERPPIEHLHSIGAHHPMLMESQATQNIVVYGEGGSGKSTLVWMLCQDGYPTAMRRSKRPATRPVACAFRIYQCAICVNGDDPGGFTGMFPHRSYIHEAQYRDDGTSRVDCPNCHSNDHVSLQRHFTILDTPAPQPIRSPPFNASMVCTNGITVNTLRHSDICLYCIRLDTFYSKGLDYRSWQHSLSMLETIGMTNVVFLVTCSDLPPPEVHRHFISMLLEDLAGTSFADSPIIPIALTTPFTLNNHLKYGINTDILMQTLVHRFSQPMRVPLAAPRLTVVRSFNVSQSGCVTTKENMDHSLKGGILVALLTEGCLMVGESLEITPGVLNRCGQIRDPLNLVFWRMNEFKTKITSLQCNGRPISIAFPGAMIGIETNIDPYFTKSDFLAGNQARVYSRCSQMNDYKPPMGSLQPGECLKLMAHRRFNPFPNIERSIRDLLIFTQLSVSFSLFRARGEQEDLSTDPAEKRAGQSIDINWKTPIVFLINCVATDAMVIQIKTANYDEVNALHQVVGSPSNRQGVLKAELAQPVTASVYDQVLIYRRSQKIWRLCGYGHIVSGLALSDTEGSYAPLSV